MRFKIWTEILPSNKKKIKTCQKKNKIKFKQVITHEQ